MDDMFFQLLAERRPNLCPDEIFLKLVNFGQKIYKKVPLFRLPDGVHWCEEDSSLELNYSKDSMCLFVDKTGCSLCYHNEEDDGWIEGDDEIIAFILAN